MEASYIFPTTIGLPFFNKGILNMKDDFKYNIYQDLRSILADIQKGKLRARHYLEAWLNAKSKWKSCIVGIDQIYYFDIFSRAWESLLKKIKKGFDLDEKEDIGIHRKRILKYFVVAIKKEAKRLYDKLKKRREKEDGKRDELIRIKQEREEESVEPERVDLVEIRLLSTTIFLENLHKLGDPCTQILHAYADLRGKTGQIWNKLSSKFDFPVSQDSFFKCLKKFYDQLKKKLDLEHKKSLMLEASVVVLNKMKKNDPDCYFLISTAVTENLSPEEIKNKFDLPSKRAAITKKFKCMQKFRASCFTFIYNDIENQ